MTVDCDTSASSIHFCFCIKSCYIIIIFVSAIHILVYHTVCSSKCTSCMYNCFV